MTTYLAPIEKPRGLIMKVVYFFARLAHYVVYSAAIPVARTLTFTAGWLAQIAIIASILRWI